MLLTGSNLFLKMINRYSFLSSVIIIFLFTLSCCTGIKPLAVTAVEKYSTVAGGLSTLPPKLYNRAYQLRMQTQTLQLSAVIATNSSAKESIAALQTDLNDKLQFLDMVDSFGYAYQIMGKYAELLHAIISPVYLKDFVKNKKEWETSFNVLLKTYSTTGQKLPATAFNNSVGGFTAELIKQLGLGKIKTLQKKYLKAAVTNARISFEAICNNFLTVDIPKISNELQALPNFIDENYKDFLNNIQAYENKQGNNPYNYYKLYLPLYLNWQLELRELNTLARQLTTCFKSLRDTYAQFEYCITHADTIRELPKELTALEAEYNLLTNTISKFSAARERVFTNAY
jgi:hypothetical protein